MNLDDYFSFIKNPHTVINPRVLLLPPGKGWTRIRQYYREQNCFEMRLSDIIVERDWLPMPGEVFRRVSSTLMSQCKSKQSFVVIGFSGYLSLLKNKQKEEAIVSLRSWLDASSGMESVWLLQLNEGTKEILNIVFRNPRYRQGKQLIDISPEPVSDVFSSAYLCDSVRAEVMLVEQELDFLIPNECDSFNSYLKYTEEHPCDVSAKRIVIASKGKKLPGICGEIKQIVRIQEFAQEFYNIEDVGLSNEALRWMCALGKDGLEKCPCRKLEEMLNAQFFVNDSVIDRVLLAFDIAKDIEREALIWLVKQLAPRGSYLERVISQCELNSSNFLSAYVISAVQFLDNAAEYCKERMTAIRQLSFERTEADIQKFIKHCEKESTSRVAPWLNCRTKAEYAELLRRCKEDGIVSNAVKAVYLEVAAYLDPSPVFGCDCLEKYFADYRELKMTNRVTQEFCIRSQQISLPVSTQSRDEVVQKYASDCNCALLVVDAMGAEWLPMLIKLASMRNIGMEMNAICSANLPTTTSFNNISWINDSTRLPDVKRFDNIVHHGVEQNESRSAEENLAAALAVIGGEVLPRVSKGLSQYDRVLVTSDHGSTRLAVLAKQSDMRFAHRIDCEEGVDIADFRYRVRAKTGQCPPNMEETLDGEHWVVRGYNRLPKRGGGRGFEMHGGASLEERLVPVVVFSSSGKFEPTTAKVGQKPQIVEKEEFDL